MTKVRLFEGDNMMKANETFSAFLDGEASELDVQRMLKALDEQPDLYDQWHDLSRTKAVLQDDVLVDTALNYSPNLKLESTTEKPKGFTLRLYQGGIAAGVALVVVVSANFGLSTTPTSAPIAKVDVIPEVNSTMLAQQQFEAQQRLDNYLREHAELASFTTGHVVVPSTLEWVEAQTE